MRWQEFQNKELWPFVWGKLGSRSTLYLGETGPGDDTCVVNNSSFQSKPGYADIFAARRQQQVPDNSFNGQVSLPTIPDQLLRAGIAAKNIAVFAGWSEIDQVVSQRSDPRFRVSTASPGEWPTLNDAVRRDKDVFRDVTRHLRRHKKRMRLLYVIFNEPDYWAHQGEWEKYAEAIRQADGFMDKIYRSLEADPKYRRQTAYIVTTDHGRGSEASWHTHGWLQASRNIWAVVSLPPGMPLGPAEWAIRNSCDHATLGKLPYWLLNSN